MARIRALFGQTAIYGLTSVVSRLPTFLLVPYHVSNFAPDEYGIITDLYAVMAFLNVILSFGMETAFFRFLNKYPHQRDYVISTGYVLMIGISLGFIVLGFMMSSALSDVMGYSDRPQLVWMFIMILAIDNTMVISFAKLRAEKRVLRFAFAKISNVLVFVSLNVWFISYMQGEKIIDTSAQGVWINSITGAGYVFLANLIATIYLTIVMARELPKRWRYSTPMMKAMVRYASPVMVAGVAGMVSEMMDKQFLKALLPTDIRMTQLGIYGACYKIGAFISITVYAFRMGAEPFFFSIFSDKDAKRVYARVMHYFVILLSLIYVLICTHLYLFRYFVPNEQYWEGLKIVPVVLLANLFLGVSVNLSIWYKVSAKTQYAVFTTGLAGLVTIGGNLILIPIIGYMGSAWTTLAAYVTMTIASYLWSRRHYAVPYDIPRFFIYITVGSVISFGSYFLFYEEIIINLLLFSLYLTFIVWTERKSIRQVIALRKH